MLFLLHIWHRTELLNDYQITVEVVNDVKQRKEIMTGQTDPESSLGEALRRDQPIQCEKRQTSQINSIQLLFTPV